MAWRLGSSSASNSWKSRLCHLRNISTAMAPLSPASAQALARLRAYVPPPSLYTNLPLSRRAAVLILLFADRRGDLRVVLTVRSAVLRSFAGHVAFPGGKADTLIETPVQTARREAFEEIGLPLEDNPPPPFAVEHITELPLSLAITNLAVRPCVAYLSDEVWGGGGGGSDGDGNGSGEGKEDRSVEDTFMPRLDPEEVQCVFTVPLERFLRVKYGGGNDEGDGNDPEGRDRVKWYHGSWLPWNGGKWKLHEFQAPVWGTASLARHRVWGMTARILVDAARIAYGRDPEFSCVPHVGDEEIIRTLLQEGELAKEREKAEESVIYSVSKSEKGNL